MTHGEALGLRSRNRGCERHDHGNPKDRAPAHTSSHRDTTRVLEAVTAPQRAVTVTSCGPGGIWVP
jgi:hypothetical protein